MTNDKTKKSRVEELYDAEQVARRNGLVAEAANEKVLDLLMMLHKQNQLPEKFLISVSVSEFGTGREIENGDGTETRLAFDGSEGGKDPLLMAITFTNSREALPQPGVWEIIDLQGNAGREVCKVVNHEDIDSGCMCESCKRRRKLSKTGKMPETDFLESISRMFSKFNNNAKA